MGITIPMTLNFNRGHLSLATKIEEGDTIAVRLGGDFHQDASIDDVTIFENHFHPEKGDGPGAPICGWNRSGDHVQGACSMYVIQPVSDTEVTITDNEDPVGPIRRWFGISVTADGATYKIDPELINRPRPPQ